MKKVSYNKSDIMTQAWIFFNDEWAVSDHGEYFEYGVTNESKTFSDCLKAAWKKEKEIVDRINKKYEDAENTEEFKAWGWACKKLGVEFEMDAYTKVRRVEDMYKETWNGSVWSAAMKAVKLEIKLVA